MILGLYDIDLWHSPRKFPNLELMKIYNYHSNINDKVIMMTPKMDEGRFDEIIYFKETPFKDLPKSLSVFGKKKKIFGYGFYQKSEFLPENVQKTPPSFLPYDLYFDKLTNKNDYNTLRRSSLIRLRTNDLTGIQNNNKNYYIVDYDPLGCDNLLDFIKQYPDKKFLFFYSLKFTDENTLNNFEPFAKQIVNRFHIAFKFNLDFFKTHLNGKYVYYGFKTDENDASYWLRIIKCILIVKQNNKPINFLYLEDDKFSKSLEEWLRHSKAISYYNYYKDTENEGFINSMPQKIRLLLKQNPQTFDSKNIDLWEKI